MLQSLTEIFSRNIFALFPLRFQRAMFVGEHSGDFIDDISDQRIRLLDSGTWLIHKLALDLIPERAKVFRFLMVKQRSHRSGIRCR